jgi:hypothetical protein
MSLWHKPIHLLDFQDVDGFCKAGWEENDRLDYKGEWPSDLAKTVAAMANSVGGTIILGVDADTKTNKPIWPPVPVVPPRAGLPMTAGLTERVIQVSRDNIFPPLIPEVSPAIPNQHLNGHAIVVVRVPESKDAPHATDAKRHVYVYERTGNQNNPHQPADIEYIERLIRRRQQNEEIRERLIAAAINRGRTWISVGDQPYRWVSVIPFYPSRPVSTPEHCFQFHSLRWITTHMGISPMDRHQRAPGGSFCVSHERSGGNRHTCACSSVSDNGHVFAISSAFEATPAEKTNLRYIDFQTTAKFALSVIRAAKDFYGSVANDSPGYVMVSLGIFNARGLIMGGQQVSPGYGPTKFPDDHFRANTSILNIGQLTPEEIAKPLLEEFCFGFDAVER